MPSPQQQQDTEQGGSISSPAATAEEAKEFARILIEVVGVPKEDVKRMQNLRGVTSFATLFPHAPKAEFNVRLHKDGKKYFGLDPSTLTPAGGTALRELRSWFASLPGAQRALCPNELIPQELNHKRQWVNHKIERQKRKNEFLFKVLLLAILVATPFLAGVYIVRRVEASSLAVMQRVDVVMTQTCAAQGFDRRGDFGNLVDSCYDAPSCPCCFRRTGRLSEGGYSEVYHCVTGESMYIDLP